MNAEYFKDMVLDELESAESYIKNAFELRSMSPEMAKTFYDMSAQELNHATNFYNMYHTYHKAITSTMKEGSIPNYIDEITKEIDEKYLNMSAQIRVMHQMYSK